MTSRSCWTTVRACNCSVHFFVNGAVGRHLSAVAVGMSEEEAVVGVVSKGLAFMLRLQVTVGRQRLRQT